jgi:hypothetical protein
VGTEEVGSGRCTAVARTGDAEGGSGWWAVGGVATGSAEEIVIFYLFKLISNGIDLIRSKDGLSELESFQIKYGIDGN